MTIHKLLDKLYSDAVKALPDAQVTRFSEGEGFSIVGSYHASQLRQMHVEYGAEVAWFYKIFPKNF